MSVGHKIGHSEGGRAVSTYGVGHAVFALMATWRFRVFT